jgi:hypothetical protein
MPRFTVLDASGIRRRSQGERKEKLYWLASF